MEVVTLNDRAPTEEEAALGARVRERAWAGKLELPMLPEVVQRLLVAVSDERSDARQMADLVRRDPTIAAHLLRVANSAIYAPREPIVSVQQALARLGTSAIRQILLVISCQTRAFRVKGREAEIRRELDAALSCACFAQEIARLRDGDDGRAVQRFTQYLIVHSCICFGAVPFGQLPD